MKTQASNVFLLGSGIQQLLNSLEAAEFYDCSTESVILVSNRLRRHTDYLGLMNWSQVHWVRPFSEVAMLPQPKRIVEARAYTWHIGRLLESLRGCTRVFVGEYTEFFRHLVSWLRPSEVIYITDGAEVALSSTTRANELRSGRGKMSLLRKLVYGWRAEHIKALTYFSALPPTLTSADCWVRNEYHFLREHFSDNFAQRPVVAFAGQRRYESRKTPDEMFSHYWTSIGEVATRYSCPVEYWPHPKEDPHVVKARCDEFGLVFREEQDPIEIAFLKEGFPKALVGYCSSSLYSCKALFGESGLDAYYLKATDFLERRWEPLREAYHLLGITPWDKELF